jgi:hypothetical protein
LAKLTGQQRDELRKQIEAQQSNERFQIALQGATEETRRRLVGFAGTVGRLAPGLEEGFQDLIANAGRPVTDSAIALIQNIPEAQGIIQKLISGQISSEEALGKIRNASIRSMNRFGQATVTGQVGFLRLQGDVINLGRRIVDVNGVFQEQEESVGSLVSNLTSFEQATKVLASQFQGIETGMLRAFGPALGGLIGGIQGMFAKGGALAKTLKENPSMTAGLIVAGLTGKFLFSKAVQIGIVAAGTRIGTAHIIPGGLSGAGIARGGLGKGIGVAAGMGLGIGGIAAAGTAETAGGRAMGIGSAALGGGMTGAMIGSMIAPGIGTIIGGAIGTAIGGGSALFASSKNPNNERAFGGPMVGGQSYLTHTNEMITPGTSSQVTAKKDIKDILNLDETNKHLAAIFTAQTSANKTHSQHLDALNTSNMLQSKIKMATENTARQDRNRLVSG